MPSSVDATTHTHTHTHTRTRTDFCAFHCRKWPSAGKRRRYVVCGQSFSPSSLSITHTHSHLHYHAKAASPSLQRALGPTTIPSRALAALVCCGVVSFALSLLSLFFCSFVLFSVSLTHSPHAHTSPTGSGGLVKVFSTAAHSLSVQVDGGPQPLRQNWSPWDNADGQRGGVGGVGVYSFTAVDA